MDVGLIQLIDEISLFYFNFDIINILYLQTENRPLKKIKNNEKKTIF
jgi:hypothetical protein